MTEALTRIRASRQRLARWWADWDRRASLTVKRHPRVRRWLCVLCRRHLPQLVINDESMRVVCRSCDYTSEGIVLVPSDRYATWR